MEDLALDRRRLDHGPLQIVELIETRGQERMDRWRHRDIGKISRRGPMPVVPDEQDVEERAVRRLADRDALHLVMAGRVEREELRDVEDL